MTIESSLRLVFFGLALVGCTGEKPGDPCDKFFQNTCKSPMSCVDTGEHKVCASSCDLSLDPMPPHKVCKDPAFEPVEVQYSQGTTDLGSAGCHCLPRSGGAKASASPSASAAPPVTPSASAAPVASAAPSAPEPPPPASAPPKATPKPKPKPKK